MGTCQVWEYYNSGNNRDQTAKLPGNAPQNVTISATHAETASALDNATIGVRLLSDTDCWFKLYKSGAASPLGDVCTTANGIKTPVPFDLSAFQIEANGWVVVEAEV